jgi:hypothetical protein
MKTKFLVILTLISLTKSIGQTIFHTEDITNFYTAFDSVQKTNDKKLQIDFIQKLYLEKNGVGINYMIDNSVENRKTIAEDWLNMMINTKENLLRIRPYFKNLESQKKILESKFLEFKSIYPAFKDGEVYFEMGLGMFGGRPFKNNLIIGSEMYANKSDDWAVYVVLHEYVHTLQKMTYNSLLAQTINEGAADFIAEIVYKKNLWQRFPDGYIDFGYKNEKQIWNEYKKYIASNEKGKFFDWLYGQKGITINDIQMKDLGYFMGYKFCKSYYENAVDKKQAIKEIIEIDLSTDENAKAFLLKSKYATKNDSKFIENLKFLKVIPAKKNMKMIVYGYKFDKENIIFEYELPVSCDLKNLKYISVAGTFNGWNPQDIDFRLKNIKDRKFQFSLPKSKIKEKNNQFKFVINGDNWQTVPENAINVESGNLTFEIK